MESRLLLDILKSDPFVKKLLCPRILTKDDLSMELKNDRLYVVHSSSRDTPSKNGCVPGHFVIIDTIRKKNRSSLTFFDTYGRPFPYQEIQKIVINYLNQHHATFEFNDIRYQAKDEFNCADLCIYFALLRSRGKSMKKCQKMLRLNLSCITRLINKLVLLRTRYKKRIDFKGCF